MTLEVDLKDKITSAVEINGRGKGKDMGSKAGDRGSKYPGKEETPPKTVKRWIHTFKSGQFTIS